MFSIFKNWKEDLPESFVVFFVALVRSPECNGMIERWHRNLNEQIIEVNAFESLEHGNAHLTC
jgi:hypothetical protein